MDAKISSGKFEGKVNFTVWIASDARVRISKGFIDKRRTDARICRRLNKMAWRYGTENVVATVAHCPVGPEKSLGSLLSLWSTWIRKST